MSASSFDRVHGGLDPDELRRAGLVPHDVVDFSVNINPYGPCEAVLQAVRNAPLDIYPDPQARVARRAWASVLGVSPQAIAVGHGASDLFWAIARARLRAGDTVVIAEPTFSEFRVAAEAARACVRCVIAEEESGFVHNLDALADAARHARALYVCAPNNPTGRHVAADDIAQLARALPSTWLVLDQSFLSLSDQAAESNVALPANVLRVRSLTKDFCLPGLRIGLVIADEAVVQAIEAARPTWPTSAQALAAIAGCADAGDFVAESYACMRRDREATRSLLLSEGLHPLSSSTTFQLVGVGSGAATRSALLKRRILVRDCASFGLPAHIRIAARPERDRQQLAVALAGLREDRERLREGASLIDR